MHDIYLLMMLLKGAIVAKEQKELEPIIPSKGRPQK